MLLLHEQLQVLSAPCGATWLSINQWPLACTYTPERSKRLFLARQSAAQALLAYCICSIGHRASHVLDSTATSILLQTESVLMLQEQLRVTSSDIAAVNDRLGLGTPCAEKHALCLQLALHSSCQHLSELSCR